MTPFPRFALGILLVSLAACRSAPATPPGAATASDTAPAAAPAVAAAPLSLARLPGADSLAPGAFVWNADRVPEGPVLVVVSLPEQLAHVYRNGVEIGRSSVSTGRKGHRTPTGVFQILQKDKRHHSSKYNNAAMPYMERLTWDGIALHAGQLPGYPASHGCVRLPLEFSKLLFGATSMGGTVVIADEAHGGAMVAHPGFLAPPVPGRAVDSTGPTGAWSWRPERADSGPISIVISSASRDVHVLRNGVEIGRAPISLLDGEHHFAPATYVRTTQPAPGVNPYAPDVPMMTWMMVGDSGSAAMAPAQLARAVRMPRGFSEPLFQALGPGTVLVLTDEPLEPTRRSEPGFTVMTTGAEG
jgi:hypothetical protein